MDPGGLEGERVASQGGTARQGYTRRWLWLWLSGSATISVSAGATTAPFCCPWGRAMPGAPSPGRRQVPPSPPGSMATPSPS